MQGSLGALKGAAIHHDLISPSRPGPTMPPHEPFPDPLLSCDPGGVFIQVLCLKVQSFLYLAWPSHQRLSPGGQRACPLPSVCPPRLGRLADTAGGVDGGAGGSRGPAAQQAGGTQHAPPSKMHARQPHPALATSKPAVPTAGLATSRAPRETHPRGWGTGTGGPRGASWGPKSPVRVLLSAEFRLRQFGRSGGRSSPRLTSGLPLAGGQHLATLPCALRPATHSGWTPVPRPGQGVWGEGPAAVGPSALTLLFLPYTVSLLIHSF